MPVYEIPSDELIFPHPLDADPSGLLGVGGDLSRDRLLLAYRHGIFPWYSAGEPTLWWFPDPRCVLFPEKLKLSKSMRKILRERPFMVTFNKAFDQVIEACRNTSRAGQEGTWIHDEMILAYQDLHHSGYAHSTEVWQNNKLVGGLYGIIVGKIFFGESMFNKVSNASKYALAKLTEKLIADDFALIDCQQDTPHMRSMGAELISAELFYSLILANQNEHLPGNS